MMTFFSLWAGQLKICKKCPGEECKMLYELFPNDFSIIARYSQIKTINCSIFYTFCDFSAVFGLNVELSFLGSLRKNYLCLLRAHTILINV